MLNIYLPHSIDKSRVKLLNDAWFNLNVSKMKFDKTIVDIIESVDGAKYLGNFKIKGCFDDFIYPVITLSTGCKTLLNIYNYPNIVFTLSECGANAVNKLFDLKNGSVFLDMFIIVPDKLKHNIVIHDGSSVKQIRSAEKLQQIIYERLG